MIVKFARTIDAGIRLTSFWEHRELEMTNPQKPPAIIDPDWPLDLVAGIILQGGAYYIGVDIFGSPEAYTIFLWVVILPLAIAVIIWLKVTKKGIFAIDEEE